MRLTSWVEKSPNWCSPNELIALQTCVQSMVDKNVKLVDVIQVMLVRRILPCQERAKPMWEHEPEDPATVRHLYGTTPDKIWGQLFQPHKEWPAEGKDIGLDAANPPKEVSNIHLESVFRYSHGVLFGLNLYVGFVGLACQGREDQWPSATTRRASI